VAGTVVDFELVFGDRAGKLATVCNREPAIFAPPLKQGGTGNIRGVILITVEALSDFERYTAVPHTDEQVVIPTDEFVRHE